MNKKKSEVYIYNLLTNNYSGGVKLTELVTKVVQDFHLNEEFAKECGFDKLLLHKVADYIEEVCAISTRVAVLEYEWWGACQGRIKSFIYTK